MIRIFTLVLIALSIFTTNTEAQQHGLTYKQFFNNPYLFNPAYVGINNSIEANLTYRQQWTNFKDAPATGAFSMQFPTTERIALGFNVSMDRQVLVNNLSMLATFGYIVPIASNQSLRFGISGGLGHNKLDLTADELNSSDPAIRNAATNTLYVKGNFGALYTMNGLRLGFALTDLFESDAFTTKGFNDFKLSNLKNRLYSASYRFSLGMEQNIAIEPYVLYRQFQDSKLNGWEAAALVYFKKLLWTGGSYNQHSGLAIFMGFNLRDRFRISYSYEFPPFKTAHSAMSSHELQFGIRFNTKKSKSIVKKSPSPKAILANELRTEPPVREPQRSLGNKNPARMVVTETDVLLPFAPEPERKSKVEAEKPAVSHAKKVDGKKTPAKPGQESFTMVKGHYYVVVSVFSLMSHSIKFSKELIQKGHAVSVVLNPKNNFYYVYIFSSPNIEEARRVRNEYKWKNLFKEAWVFTMTK